ncbi:MAG: hypothetical protein WBK77_04675 [Alphaproteobacteria bacterium]
MAVGTKESGGLQGGKADGRKRSVEGTARLRPGVSDFLAGEAKDFVGELYPFLPQELIGGVVPHVPGTEEEAVWNAAAQACSTEKVHFCYSVHEGKVWYLACPSSSMASNPNSWCPLAAALPGRSEYWDKETVYLYEQEGIASALRWDPETGRMQVFLGAARTILPRVQSMDANFVTINPEVAEVVPWRNKMLKTEKLSRATARMLLFSGMIVALIVTFVLIANYISINMIERNLSKVHTDTENASNDLMLKAHSAMQSDTIKHMVRVQELLDGLAAKDGTLVRYEVKGGKVEWEALLPPAFAAEFGQPLGIEKDGRVRVKNSK